MRVLPTSSSPTARRPRVATAATVAIAIVLSALVAGPAAAVGTQGDPTVSPVTTVSADGRTGTDGVRTLAVSEAADLDGAGTTMSVGGSGYDENKGIYVALCAIPPRNYVPTPCGGGVDTEGTQGAAQWISSNPPSYGVGLAQPYGPGGSFQTSFTVRAEIAPGIDCRQVRCALVTRNDHTRTSDRSQDILIPVTFRAAAVTPPPTDPGVTPTVPGPTPATTAPAVTIPPLANPTTTLPAPTATVAADGLSASDGTRTLAVTRAADLDPATASITVTGTGFDATKGIYVGLCAVPAAGEGPGPCRTGSPEANRWVSSNPPDYGVGVATPFTDGGAFEIELSLEAVIDATTDCRRATCAVVARADDTNADDRTLDLAVPVTFAEASAGTTVPPTTEPDGATDAADDAERESASSVVIDDGGSSAAAIIAVIATIIVLALAGVAFATSRRAAADRFSITPPTTSTSGLPPGSDPEAGADA